MVSAWSILLEYMGTFTRPDASGNRMGSSIRKTTQRPSNYPYDMDDPTKMYGNPNVYDRGSNSPETLHHSITPKDVKHSAWDDAVEDVDEAMGVPFNLTISGKSQMGGTMAGANGHGWAGGPTKPWDDEEGDDPMNHFKQKVLQDEGMGAWGMHPGQHEVMPPEEIPHAEVMAPIVLGLVGQEDGDGDLSDPESQGTAGFGLPSAIAIAAGEPFSATVGARKKMTRTSNGSQRESAWETAREFLVD